MSLGIRGADLHESAEGSSLLLQTLENFECGTSSSLSHLPIKAYDEDVTLVMLQSKFDFTGAKLKMKIITRALRFCNIDSLINSTQKEHVTFRGSHTNEKLRESQARNPISGAYLITVFGNILKVDHKRRYCRREGCIDSSAGKAVVWA